MLVLEEQKFNDSVVKLLAGETISWSFLQQLRLKRLTSPQIIFLMEDIHVALKENPNNASALALASYIHSCGVGKSVDYPEAIRLSELAIALGNATAMQNRAVMHQCGQGGLVNYPAAIALYEQAIALGNTDAMNDRAFMHQHGQGGRVDYPAAIALYEQAIALGNGTAMQNRAFMHQCGQGGPVNYPAAIALYEQAIALGDADAMNNRGVMHQCGQGGPVNFPAAIALYEQAIALGHATAMYHRAVLHEIGEPPDYPAAIALYEQAIALGNEPAMHNRASMHQLGEGGPVDQVKAAKLIRLLNLKKSSLEANVKKGLDNLIAHLKQSLNPGEFTEEQYHLSFIEQTTPWRKEPLKFLAFLARDEQATLLDCVTFVGKIIALVPTIVNQLNDQASLDLVGEYYYQQASSISKKGWCNLDKNKSRDGIDKAIALLKQVPTSAKRQGDACFDIAYHLYHHYSAVHHLPILGVLKAHVYLLSGIKLNHKGCQEMLEDLLRLVCQLNDIYDPTTSMGLTNLLADFNDKQLAAQLVALIRGIPVELDQIIYRSKQTPSAYLARISFYSYRWLVGDQAFLTCRDQLVAMIDQDELLQKDNLENADILELAERYLTQVSKAKQTLSPYFRTLCLELEEIEQLIQSIKVKVESYEAIGYIEPRQP